MLRRTGFLLAALLLAAGPARGQALLEGWQAWHEAGLTGVRYAHHGDETVTPYPVDGDDAYLESNLQSWNVSTPGHEQRFQLQTLGGSDTVYRSDDNQPQVERVQYFLEEGRTAVPYRMHLGDFYGELSQQTLERPLKGLQLEFQPDLFGADYTTSLLFLNGIIHPDWRHLDNHTGSSHGVSWMVESGDAKVDVHYLYNRLRDTGPLDRRDQNVLGFALADRLGWFPGTPRLEAEGNWFGGDVAVSPSRVREDRDASSFLVTLRDWPGASGWGYGVEYEDHSRWYNPAGTPVNPDREILRGDLLGRGFGQRIKLHGEDHERSESTLTPLEERFYSLSLEGNWGQRLSHRLYAAREDIEGGPSGRDDRIETLRWTVYRDLSARLELEAGVLARLRENQSLNLTEERTRGGRAGLKFFLNDLFGGGSGSLRAGVLGRRSTLQPPFTVEASSRELEPYLDLVYSAGNHSLAARWNTVDQDRTADLVEDVTTYDGRLDYQYRLSPNHRLDVSYEFYRRQSDAAEDGESGVLSLTVKWFWGTGSGPAAGTESPGVTLEG